MTIESREAIASLQDIAAVEKRTREALCYSGSSTIFIMWGLLVACGYGATAWQPGAARTIWLVVSAVGSAATALIVAARMRARPREGRDWRIVWALVALMIYGAGWSWVLGPVIPRHLIYAFQPSLVMLGMVLAGPVVGRFFVALGLVGPRADPDRRNPERAVAAAVDGGRAERHAHRRRAAAPPRHRPMSGGNDVIHQATRLRIMAALNALAPRAASIEFTRLVAGRRDRRQSRRPP